MLVVVLVSAIQYGPILYGVGLRMPVYYMRALCTHACTYLLKLVYGLPSAICGMALLRREYRPSARYASLRKRTYAQLEDLACG